MRGQVGRGARAPNDARDEHDDSQNPLGNTSLTRSACVVGSLRARVLQTQRETEKGREREGGRGGPGMLIARPVAG